MNKKRLLKLADVIENSKLDMKFQMDTWARKTECGTAGCIAGHAVALFRPKRFEKLLENSYGMPNEAANALGLDQDTADELFIPWASPKSNVYSPQQVHRKMAAKALRNLVETGKVRYDRRTTD